MVVYLSLRTRCMRAGVRRIRAGGIGSGWSRACELPSCIGQIVTRSCTRYSRAVGAAAAGAPKPRGRRIGTCSHTAPPARHSGGHSSGRPSRSHTWHHSCRTYFVMYICVLRDLTGTTRLCDHIVRMRACCTLCPETGVTAHTGETSGEEVRGGSGPQTPRPHSARDQTRSGKTSSAAGRTAGLLACWFEKIEIYPTRAK